MIFEGESYFFLGEKRLGMKSSCIIIGLWLGISAGSLAQTITIISGHTRQPLPFATIQNLNAQWAVVGSDKGLYSFSPDNSKPGDSILITYTGYEPQLLIHPVNSLTVIMKPKAEVLKPVEVLPCRGTKTGQIHNVKGGKSNTNLGSNEEALASWAAYIPNPQGAKGIITSVGFSISTKDIPASAWKAPFKLKLLHFDARTQLPSTPLLNKEIIVYPQSAKVVTDLSEEWLRLPENGLVVAVDFFYAGEEYVYQWPVRQYKEDGSYVDTTMNTYGAKIKAIRGKTITGKGFIYNYRKNEWHTLESYTGEMLAPKMEIRIKYCE